MTHFWSHSLRQPLKKSSSCLSVAQRSMAAPRSRVESLLPVPFHLSGCNAMQRNASTLPAHKTASLRCGPGTLFVMWENWQFRAKPAFAAVFQGLTSSWSPVRCLATKQQSSMTGKHEGQRGDTFIVHGYAATRATSATPSTLLFESDLRITQITHGIA